MNILFLDTETDKLPIWEIPSDDPLQPHVVQLGCILSDSEGNDISTVDVIVKPDACPLDRFMVEDLRSWAYAHGLDRVKNERSWGGVITKAVKLGLVMHNGYRSVKNPKAHCTPASVWLRVGRLNKAVAA